MKTSESIINLAKALAESQKEIKNVLKDATGQFSPDKNKKTYATLAAVIEDTKELLAKNGIVVIQALQDKSMVTRLLHVSGEWIESSFELLIEKPSMQGLGSACTYARRYSLAAMLNIAQADDDGQEAEKHPQQNTINTQQALENSKKETNVADLSQYVMKAGGADVKGKKIIDIPTIKLGACVSYFRGEEKKANKALTGAVRESVEAAEAYLLKINTKAPPKLDTDEKMPF